MSSSEGVLEWEPGVELPKAVENLRLVEKAYPEKGSELRRAHYLFSCGKDSFYRVNVHDTDRGNVVVRSFFVQVHGRSVIDRTKAN